MGTTQNPDGKNINVVIEYCVPCDLREPALSVSSELLKEHQQDIGSVTLLTGSGGVFDVKVNDRLVFSKNETGRLPEEGEVLHAFQQVTGAVSSA